MVERSDRMRRLDVQDAVSDELVAQDDKWGTQDHPDVHEEDPDYDRKVYGIWADRWKGANAGRVERRSLAWDGILLEEVYEALAESDEGRLYDELIQVAAVAQQWAEAILRRQDRDV